MELSIGMIFKTSYTPDHWCKITRIMEDGSVCFVDTDGWEWGAPISYVIDCINAYGKKSEWKVKYYGT